MRRCSLLLASALLALPASTRAQDHTGPDADPYGICAHLADDPTIDALALERYTWLRCDFNWNILEPTQKGQFDFSQTDRVVTRALANNQRIYASLAYTPGWANGGQPGYVPPTNPQDWYDFVYAVVSHYKGQIHHWGMWNEPNLTGFFTGTEDQYIQQILVNGANAAKAADPTCFVLGPELAHLEGGHWEQWLQDVLSRAGDRIDIVTQHIYDSDANGVLNLLDGKPQLKPSVKYILDHYGRGQEVWLTEVGWSQPGTSEATQASECTNVLQGMLDRGYLTRVFLYEAQDDPNATDKYGILRADGSQKPAATATASFIAAHQGVRDWVGFDPATDFQHGVGRAVPGGFQAQAGQDPAGFLLFGPYTNKIAAGKRVAVYRLQVDATQPASEVVATLDVNDAAASRVVASRDVTRGDFRAASSFQRIWLDFDAPAGGNLEFRVNFHGKGTLLVESVEVRPGSDVAGGSGCEIIASGRTSPGALAPLALVALGFFCVRRRAGSRS
jgi:hypothetical protein